MSTFWYVIGAMCMLTGLFMVIVSLRALFSTWRKRSRLFSQRKTAVWGTSNVHNTITFLCNGCLLFLVPPGIDLLHRDRGVGFFWGATLTLLYGCFRVYVTSVDIAVTKRADEEAQNVFSHWYYHARFHQNIAMVICLLGLGITILLDGLVTTNVLLFQTTNLFSWFSFGFMVIGGLYWLAAYVISNVVPQSSAPPARRKR